ncbi:glycosyltransferase family 2 protein [Shouchella patagoniensis]|uniref:glycosyltransferase family 2 protein n=1 Tax=Shouchella patagoniensis TaxID=228576 RepID=UPI0009951286|nr:glycosyltransferase family 2 protein [Shouchella patagoniensis]
MEEIEAIIIMNHRHHPLFLTLASIERIKDEVQVIWIIHPPGYHLPKLASHCVSYPIQGNDIGETLNHLLPQITAPYVLLLGPGASLSTKVNITSAITSNPGVTGNHHALLVKQALSVIYPFPDQKLLPFTEALLSFWFHFIPFDSKIYCTAKEEWASLATSSKQTSLKAKQEWIDKYKLNIDQAKTLSITVLIANYNQSSYVDNAIASCLVGSFIPEQIFVVDDGSTDGSAAYLSKWNTKNVRTFFNKQNEGKARALNHLIPFIKSEYVIELDADDWFDPDAFTVLAKKLKSWPYKSSLLYGNFRRWKEQSRHQIVYKGIAKGRHVHTKNELHTYRFPLGPRIYRTTTLKELGGFPIISYEEGRLYEDVSIINLLLERGPIHYEDFTIYNVRDHDTSITQKNQSKWNGFLDQLDS